MAVGNTEIAAGNKPGADKAHAHDDTTPPPSPLRQQVDNALASPPKPSDNIKAKDIPEGVTKGSGEQNDPFTHTNRVKQLSLQLDQLSAEGKKPDDLITVGDKQMKVKDFVKEAKDLIKTELETAKNVTKAIHQDHVGVMINDSIQEKIGLAQKLGLDPKTVSMADVQRERAKGGSADRIQTIDALESNLQARVLMEGLRHAPAFVTLLEAEVTAKGYGNSKLALNQEVPQEDTRKAFELVKMAGLQDNDLKSTDYYSNAETVVGMTFASFQQERSQRIIELMRSATEAGKTGQPQTVTIDGQTKQLSQEDLLKEANILSNQINVGWIANQALLERNQQNGTSKELMAIVTTANLAKLDYVSFMSEHGQTKEAQTIFTQIKADTPYLIFNEDGSYRNDAMAALNQKLVIGVDTKGVDYQTVESNFLHAIDNGKINIDKRKPGESATELLDQIKQLNQQMKVDIAETTRVQLLEKQDLQKREQDLEKQKNRTPTDDSELASLKRRIQTIDDTIAQRNTYFERRQNLATYMEASWDEAKEDFSAANSKYKEFASHEKDPELKKALDIEGKTARTEPGFSGWWHRNIGAIAVGASIVVAAGLTIGTLGLGSALGAGLVVTAVAATAAGTAGGAAAHWAVERTVNKDAGWDSAWKGAKIGLMTSGMIVAPWATGARAAAVGGAAEIAGGANAAANVTNIGRAMGLARTLGITKTSLAAGYGMSAITEGGDYAFGIKTGKEAAIGFARGGLFNSMLMGQAMKWGTLGETAVASTATKSTLQSALGLTGKNAAIGYGLSGSMETYNYLSGQKSGADALKDFAVGGTVNTVTLSLVRKYGFSDSVGRVANANLQNTRYALQGIAFNESFGAANDILTTKYLGHDILGQPAFISEGGGGSTFISPLVADFYRSNFTSGLNTLHPGEQKRFRGNLDALGSDITAVVGIDHKYIKPYQVNHLGIFDQAQQPAQQPEQR